MTIDNSREELYDQVKHPVLHKKASYLLSKPSFYDARVTISHWQLRDLIQPSTLDNNEILYTQDDSIKFTNRKTNKIATYCKLDFNPRCYMEKDGNLVAGGVLNSVNHGSSSSGTAHDALSSVTTANPGAGNGWRGLFAFYSKETGAVHHTRLGAFINNHVSINKMANSQYTSYACNNDMFLYEASIRNTGVQMVDSWDLDFALNHSILSDDQKSLIVVGDSSSIFVLHPNQQGGSNLSRNVIETNCDTGFHTSFDSSGQHFATCFQDGTCLLYDMRKLSKPYHKIYSTRQLTTNGAFRSVKFSRGTDDLLFISEHVGRVHVIDTRDFSNHQVILLPVVDLSPNCLHGFDTSGGAAVSSNLDQGSGRGMLSPKILKYNDIISFEGSLASVTGLSQGNSFYSNPMSNASSRNFNNYRVLSAISTSQSGSASSGNSTIEDLEIPGLESLHPRSSLLNSPNPDLEYFDTEINGFDWYEDDEGSHFIVGCDKGLINWNVDSWSRRCFPSYQLS